MVETRFRAGAGREPQLHSALRQARASRKSEASWTDPLAPLHGGTPADRARRAAEAFFVESPRPLVILLDDVEHADRESRLLLDALAAEVEHRRQHGLSGTAICLIAASRESALRLAGGKELVLAPLSARASRALFSAFVKPLVIPPRLVGL